MAYIGFSPSQLAVAPFAVKSFTGDGSTTTFTLDQSVPGANEANVEVFVENVQQNPIDAYTIGGALNNSLIFSEAPVNGAAIYVIHKGEATYNLQPSTGSVTAATLDPVLRNFTVDNFTGNGSTTSFTLTDTPYSANSILVTVDGIVQTASTNYTVSGTTLDFGASAPDSGAVITVVHMGFSSGNKAVMDGSITPVKLSTGGPVWTTGGLVGIGINIPTSKLNVYDATSSVVSVDGDASVNIRASLYSTNNTGASLNYRKARGTLASPAAVATGDFVLSNLNLAYDGSTFRTISGISSAVENYTGSDNVSGYLRFDTRPSGAAATSTERMRIDSDGKMKLATSAALTGWSTGWYGIQFPNATISGAATQIDIAQNMYLSSSLGGWATMANGPSAFAQIDNGAFFWQTAPTANAGTLVTPTTVMSVANTGLLTLPFGQIKFPAVQNASADANTLDDYEEGDWTPVITGSGSNPTVSYSQQRGRYTKIGRIVSVTCQISTASLSGGAGDLRISGLPFANGFPTWSGGAMAYNSTNSVTAPNAAMIAAGATYFSFWASTIVLSLGTITGLDWYFSATYIV